MADTPQNSMSGVSTPPPDSAIVADNPDTSADITGPNANDQTVPQTAAASIPPSTPQPSQTPAPAPGQPQAPTALTGKPPVPGQQPTTPTTPVPVQDPAVAKASRFYDVAQALAGGPRYKYDVDAYGQMQKTPVPVSGQHLALAIAMEALSGAVTGAANGQGPNGAAKGTAAAFAQGKQNVQQQEAQQRQQATEDYARHAQVLETNMRMRMNAQQIGRGDAEDTDRHIAQYAPILKTLQERAPGYLQGPVKYSDFAKYNVTMDNAIPYMRVPRTDGNGQQTTDADGVKQWDTDYYIVKPGVKLSDLLTKEEMTTAQERGMPWAKNDNIIKSPMELANALNIMSSNAAWNVAKTNSDNDFKQGDAAVPGALPNVATIEPTIKNPDVNKWIEQAAADNHVDPKEIKGLAMGEAGGQIDRTSQTGVWGPLQVTTETAKSMGYDRNVPEQNVKAGTKYYAMALHDKKLNPNADPRVAAAYYYSGPKAIGPNGTIINLPHPMPDINGVKQPDGQDTATYAANFAKRIGLGDKPTDGGNAAVPTPQRLDLVAWNKLHPSTAKDVELLNGARSGLTGDQAQMLGPAFKHLSENGNVDAANNLAAYYNQNNPLFVKNHDDAIESANQMRKDKIKDDSDVQKAADIATNKQKVLTENAARITNIVKGPDNFKYDPTTSDMSSEDTQKALAAQGVTIPENWEDLYAMGHYDTGPDDYTPKVWRTGDPNVMSKAQAVSYVRKFVNPNYKEADYKGIANARVQLDSETSPVGKATAAAGTALQHMQMLHDAASVVGNGRLTALNNLANEFGLATGDSDVAVYKAIIPKLADEVSKAAMAGGSPYESQVEEGRKSLNSSLSVGSIDKVLQGYRGLIHGRLKTSDELAMRTAREHIPLGDSANAEFTKNGFDTPWADSGKTTQQPQPQQTFKPNDNTQYAKISKDGKFGMDAGGKKYVIATGQVTQ